MKGRHVVFMGLPIIAYVQLSRPQLISSSSNRFGTVLCRLPSTGRWSATGVVTTNQVARSHGSAGSFEVTDPQVLDDVLTSSPRFAGAMTIRPGGPTGGRRSMEGSVHRGNASLHRNTSQDSSKAATASTPSWLGMSHDLRAQRAKEVLLQVLTHTQMRCHSNVFLACIFADIAVCLVQIGFTTFQATVFTCSMVAAFMHHAVRVYRGNVCSIAYLLTTCLMLTCCLADTQGVCRCLWPASYHAGGSSPF